jgi:hypothetical protein
MPTKEEKAAKRERLATAKAAIDQAKAATRSANALSVTQTENQQSVAANKLLAAGCVRKVSGAWGSARDGDVGSGVHSAPFFLPNVEETAVDCFGTGDE